jgi:hypothetical protein
LTHDIIRLLARPCHFYLYEKLGGRVKILHWHLNKEIKLFKYLIGDGRQKVFGKAGGVRKNADTVGLVCQR